MENISEKCKIFMKIFVFCARCGEKRIVIDMSYNGGSEAETPS